VQPGTATLADINARLDKLERQLAAVSAALIQGDGDAVLLASSLLRDAAVEVSGLLPVPTASVRQGGAELQRRLSAAGKTFAMCRENLARRAAVVDRQLASIFPPAPADQATYGKPAGTGGKFGSRFF